MNARTIDEATWQFAQEKLSLQWSPQQISAHAGISHETVCRPAIVETRRRIGDREADTLIGRNHRQAIVSVVERKTHRDLAVTRFYRMAANAVRLVVGKARPTLSIRKGGVSLFNELRYEASVGD